MTYNKEDLAWLAGFYEGEGSIGLSGGHVRLSITQKDLWSLDRAREILGMGKIYFVKASGCSVLVMDGFEKSQYTIALIWNWLSPRRKEQAKKALTSYLILHPKSRTKASIVRECKNQGHPLVVGNISVWTNPKTNKSYCKCRICMNTRRRNKRMG